MDGFEPRSYEAWYHTSKGRWIGELEFALISDLLQVKPGSTVLDAGCGTGYFTRRFAESGLNVTGVEPDINMLGYARSLSPALDLVQARVEFLPWADDSFDFVAAITSLCFVKEPATALAEMWRVARKGVVLGLLNRESLLHKRKHNSAGYRGARWDRWREVRGWLDGLNPGPARVSHRTAVFLPGGGLLARGVEAVLPSWLPWGGFLAVVCLKSQQD